MCFQILCCTANSKAATPKTCVPNLSLVQRTLLAAAVAPGGPNSLPGWRRTCCAAGSGWHRGVRQVLVCRRTRTAAGSASCHKADACKFFARTMDEVLRKAGIISLITQSAPKQEAAALGEPVPAGPGAESSDDDEDVVELESRIPEELACLLVDMLLRGGDMKI